MDRLLFSTVGSLTARRTSDETAPDRVLNHAGRLTSSESPRDSIKGMNNHERDDNGTDQ